MFALTGVVPIEKEKRVNWHAIRADYIAGASQRALARQYGVSRTSISKHCTSEGWQKAREESKATIEQKVIQKTADLAADNAAIAAGIRRKALLLLDRLVDDYMQYTATEHRDTVRDGGRETTEIRRLRDLTEAYKALTEDLQGGNNAASELLQSLLDLERSAR